MTSWVTINFSRKTLHYGISWSVSQSVSRGTVTAIRTYFLLFLTRGTRQVRVYFKNKLQRKTKLESEGVQLKTQFIARRVLGGGGGREVPARQTDPGPGGCASPLREYSVQLRQADCNTLPALRPNFPFTPPQTANFQNDAWFIMSRLLKFIPNPEVLQRWMRWEHDQKNVKRVRIW
jgi:hypothetical protein